MRIILLNVDGLPIWAIGAYGNEWLATPNLDEFAASGIVFDAHFAVTPQRLTPQLPLRYRGNESISVDSLLEWHEAPSLRLAFDEELTEDDDPRIAEVEQFDEWFGDWFSRFGPSEDALVIFTSGQGYNMVPGNSPLHEDIVHVPLIVRLPDQEQAGRRVAHFTQSVDLLPTILQASGHNAPTHGHGFDLLPLCRGAGPIRDYAVMISSDESTAALQTTDMKIIVSTINAETIRLYIKPDDRWEVNDLRLPNIDFAEELANTLRRFLTDAVGPGPLILPALPQWEPTDGHSETSG